VASEITIGELRFVRLQSGDVDVWERGHRVARFSQADFPAYVASHHPEHVELFRQWATADEDTLPGEMSPARWRAVDGVLHLVQWDGEEFVRVCEPRVIAHPLGALPYCRFCLGWRP
jgi:hypothetical protein